MEHPSVTNNPLYSQELPCLGELPSEAISPGYRKLNLTVTVVISLLVFTVLLIVAYQPWFTLPVKLEFSLGVAGAITALLGGLIFTYHYFADRLIYYTLREQDIVLFKGLIFKKVICQPMLRIQHIDIQRGPLERLAGLATLKVYSAGGSDHTLAIPGLPEETAEKMRQFVLNHSDLTRE